MMRWKSLFTTGGRRVGLIFVHEQGLDLEVWDGRPCPCWSMGVVRVDADGRAPEERIGIPRAGCWLLVLPTYLCTTRCIQLPSSRPEEIAAMLKFEIPQLAPCSMQSWTWDFCITSSGEDGTSQILVVLSPLAVVESALGQVRVLGIEPYAVTVTGALRAVRPIRGKDREGTRLCGQVWWDRGSLDFSAVDGARLMFLRGARVGGPGLQALSRVEAEVGRSLSLLREQGLGAAELPVYVGGTNPEVSHLVERLRQSAPLRADQVYDWTGWEGAWAGDGTTRGTTVGRWRSGHTRVGCVNLLPPYQKEEDHRVRRRRELLGIGLRVCVIALLLLVCLRTSVWRKTRVLGQYQQTMARIAPLAQRLQFLQAQLSMIRTQVQGSISMLDIIGQMYELLPQDVTLHYLSIDERRQVVIRAQAKWLSQAFDCIDPLERSVYLANVRQSYAHLRELDGQVLIDFELRADLERHSPEEAGP